MPEPELLAMLPSWSTGQVRAKAMRLQLHRPATGIALALQTGHAALSEARTMFPSTVRAPEVGLAVLVPGRDQRKLGVRVEKGPWSGMPLYGLTLEERATCPHYCRQWSRCMGNSMHQAARLRHGPELEVRLEAEFEMLQDTRPKGWVVRLHLLGDFYSTGYVGRWRQWLDQFPGLHVFGYTAWHPETSTIGRAVADLAAERWDRFAIRWSAGDLSPGPRRSVVIYAEDGPLTREHWLARGITLCPAQTNETDGCNTCALCWSSAAMGKTIGFIAHGGRRRGKAPLPVTALRAAVEFHGTQRKAAAVLGMSLGKLQRDLKREERL